MDYAKNLFSKARETYDNYACEKIPAELRTELSKSNNMVCGRDYRVGPTGVISTTTNPIFVRKNKISDEDGAIHPVIMIRKFKFKDNSIKIYDGYIFFEDSKKKRTTADLGKINFTAKSKLDLAEEQILYPANHNEKSEKIISNINSNLKEDCKWLPSMVEALKHI